MNESATCTTCGGFRTRSTEHAPEQPADDPRCAACFYNAQHPASPLLTLDALDAGEHGPLDALEGRLVDWHGQIAALVRCGDGALRLPITFRCARCGQAPYISYLGPGLHDGAWPYAYTFAGKFEGNVRDEEYRCDECITPPGSPLTRALGVTATALWQGDGENAAPAAPAPRTPPGLYPTMSGEVIMDERAVAAAQRTQELEGQLAAMRAELFNRVCAVRPTSNDLLGPCTATIYKEAEHFATTQEAVAWLEERFAAEHGNAGAAFLADLTAARMACQSAQWFLQRYFGTVQPDGDPMNQEIDQLRQLLKTVRLDAAGPLLQERLRVAERVCDLADAMWHGGMEVTGSLPAALTAWRAFVPEGDF